VAVELRDARHGDELAVAELHIRSWQEAYRGLLPDEFLAALDPAARAARYRFEATEDGAMRTLLAMSAEEQAGERIVGFVTFGRSRDADLPGHAEIGALYVDPDRYRGGVGRLLMAEARSRLAAAGYSEALLWVLRGNTRAAAFYEREGWSADGSSRLEDPYGVTSTVERFRRALP
jgi:ribosomal protein S18 acetylase RimI-like enzyme